MTSTANTETYASCPACKRLVAIPAQFKAVTCPWCRAKVARESGAEKVATK